MPFAIDEAAAKKQMTYDLSKPQELAPRYIPGNMDGNYQ